MHACMVFSFNYYSAEHYTVIPIWLTIDVYRMTKVNSTMTSREYMISQPPINQCSSLGGTWICMSKMCHEYAIAYCPLGIEIYWLKKRKIIWGILKLPLICWVKKVKEKKWKQITCTRYKLQRWYCRFYFIFSRFETKMQNRGYK